MTIGEVLALLANELDDPTLSHHTPAVAIRAQTWVALHRSTS